MKILSLLFSLLLALDLSAAIIYCSPSGGGSGADFNNLATLPDTTGFTRGNTYVCIEGNYGSKNLSTALSGTTTITIRKANAEDSAVAGYATTLFDAVASFGSFTLTTGYWIVDGITRTETAGWAAPAGYGFSSTQITSNSGSSQDGSNSQLRYIDIGAAYAENPSDATIDDYGEAVYLVFNQQSISFTRCAIHNGQPALVQLTGSDFITFDHCEIGPGWGKAAIRGGNGSLLTDLIIKHCKFWNSSLKDPNDPTSGTTAEIAVWSWTGTSSGTEIYGNWFFSDRSSGRNSAIVVGGNGGSWIGDGADGTLVYNNTFEGFSEDSSNGDIDLNGSSTVARNNLGYNLTGGGPLSISATTTSNNNYETSDPFVNAAAHNYHLSGALAGFSLGSPYNIDPDGVTRGVDATFDVGAYEFDEGTPSLSTAVIPTGGTTIVFTYSESVSIGAGGNAGFTMSMSGGAVTATYSSGAPGTALTYNLSRTVNTGETGTHDYTQPGNGIEATDDAADVATYTGTSVTNNSTQGGGGGSTLTISGTLTIGP